LLSDQTILVLLLVTGNQFLGLVDQLFLCVRDDHVVLAERDPRFERVTETEHHDRVREQHGVFLTGVPIDLVDHIADFTLGQQAVDDVVRNLVVLRQTFTDQHPAWRSDEALHHDIAILIGLRHAGEDAGVQRHRFGFERLVHFGHVGKARELFFLGAVFVFKEFRSLLLPLHREVVETQDHILRRHDNRLAVGG